MDIFSEGRIKKDAEALWLNIIYPVDLYDIKNYLFPNGKYLLSETATS
jgi:hypothetical protein